MTKKKNSQRWLTLGMLGLVALGAYLAFQPRETLVDIGTVTTGTIQVTIDEEGRTQVHQAYLVSMPVAGRLLRVKSEVGDVVEQGQTILAQVLPPSPPALDIRTVKRAEATVNAAKAALSSAKANLDRATAEKEFAVSYVNRARAQLELGNLSPSDFDAAKRAQNVAQAEVESAQALILQRQAELANAVAVMIGFEPNTKFNEQVIPIKSPINGRILDIIERSETSLEAGAPIMKIGDIEGDLEVVVELLSTEIVQVNVGDHVSIEKWGGTKSLSGKVSRIDPFGYTKYSALGVEEQRVKLYVEFDENEVYTKLGHGFRVEVRIIIWEKQSAILVPSSALFRNNGERFAFVVENKKAQIRKVSIERDNGIEASVVSGLAAKDRVILYPPSELEDGTLVKQR